MFGWSRGPASAALARGGLVVPVPAETDAELAVAGAAGIAGRGGRLNLGNALGFAGTGLAASPDGARDRPAVRAVLRAGFERHRPGRAGGALAPLVFGQISGAALVAGLLILRSRSGSIVLASFAHVPPGGTWKSRQTPAASRAPAVPHLRYVADVVELVEEYLYRPLARPVLWLVRQAKRLQCGRLDAYLGYMLIALVAVIAVVAALS